MGHATHFLMRLDRIAPDEVELALSLYRNRPLVEKLLKRVPLPDGADRVALSLGDAERGPYVLLGREGGFITCLARDMRPSAELPIITRAQLDAVAQQMAELKSLLELAHELTGHEGDGALPALYRKVTLEPLLLRREDVRALRAFLPVVGTTLARDVDGRYQIWREANAALTTRRAQRSPEGALDAAMQIAASTMQALGTNVQLALWAAAEYPESFGHAPEMYRALAQLSVLAANVDDARALACTLNGIARAGDAVLPYLLPEWELAVTEDAGVVGLAAALLAIAARHPRLADGIWRELARAPESIRAQLPSREALAADPFAHSLPRAAAMADVLLDRPPRPEGAPPSEVSREIHTMAWSSFPFHLYGISKHREEFYAATPLLAACEPEQLYPPATLATDARLRSLGLMRGRIWARRRIDEAKRVPVTVEAKPGRNDPCACGSGRKSKKCCAKAA